jgi:hypothetical protein
MYVNLMKFGMWSCARLPANVLFAPEAEAGGTKVIIDL